MAQPERRSPTQQPPGLEYDEGHAEQGLTALAGIPVLLQAFRSLDLRRSVERHVTVKQRQRGLDEASYVESFLILNAAGGECLDDFAHLRQDGVRKLIGHANSALLSSPSHPNFCSFDALPAQLQPLNDGSRPVGEGRSQRQTRLP